MTGHCISVNPKLAADTGQGQSTGVEPDHLIDLVGGQGPEPHLDASSLEAPGDRLSTDATALSPTRTRWRQSCSDRPSERVQSRCATWPVSEPR